MEDQLAFNYVHAPRSVRIGRVLMIIGCIAFFVFAVIDIAAFIIFISDGTYTGFVGDFGTSVQFWALPFLAVFFVVGGIGGLAYVFDKKGKIKHFATLAAIVLLVVTIVDFVLSIRGLIKDCVNPDVTTLNAWKVFGMNVLDTLLTGGIYVSGWWLTKDYMGD